MGDDLPQCDSFVDSSAADHDAENKECEPGLAGSGHRPPPSPIEPDECGPIQLDDFVFPAW